MWWAAGVLLWQVIQDRWCAGLNEIVLGQALNRRKTANADGGPAADDFEKNLKQLVAEQELAEGWLRKQYPRRNF